MRGVGGNISKCITCLELIKDETFRTLPQVAHNMQTLWHWNKIGEARQSAADKLAIDSYTPIMEILVSRVPFDEQYNNERFGSIICLIIAERAFLSLQVSQTPKQEDNLTRVRPPMSNAFASPEMIKVAPIGAENVSNVFRRRKRKRPTA